MDLQGCNGSQGTALPGESPDVVVVGGEGVEGAGVGGGGRESVMKKLRRALSPVIHSSVIY